MTLNTGSIARWPTTHGHWCIVWKSGRLRGGRFRWRRVAGNRRTVASGEGYVNAQDCFDMALKINPPIEGAEPGYQEAS